MKLSGLAVVVSLTPVFFAAAHAPAAGAQPGPAPYLVRDIDVTGEPFVACPPIGVPELPCTFYGGLPQAFVPLGERAIFLANDRTHGFEPWVSDGTAAGTHLLRDLCPGECSSRVYFLGAAGGHVYFSVIRPTAPGELWRSDGTSSGTVELEEFCRQPCPRFFLGVPHLLEDEALWMVGESTRAGSRVPEGSRWLWRLDLATGRTRPALDLCRDVDPCYGSVFDIVRRGDDLVALVTSGFEGSQPWRIPAGTDDPEPIPIGEHADARFVAADSAGRLLVFIQESNNDPGRVWAAEPGSYELAPIVELPDRRTLRIGPELSGRLYFVVQEFPFGSLQRAELWATDGSAAGTGRVLSGVDWRVPVKRLADRLLVAGSTQLVDEALLAVDPAAETTLLAVGDVSNLEVAGDRAIFDLQEEATGAEPWTTDGTPQGTEMLGDLYPGPESSAPRWFTATEEGLVFFSALHPDTDRELWAVALPTPAEPPPPPPEPPEEVPWLSAPAIDGFRVKVRIVQGPGVAITGTAEAECIAETLCVSGALAGRSEVFVRVVGPKPNGKLWPTLVKFTTSEVEVWIEQLATGEVRYYRLEGARPGFDELPGLFDRQGFEP